MQKKYLLDYTEGDCVSQTFLIARSQLRTASNGQFYLDLELCDKSGRMPAKLWRATPDMLSIAQPDDFVQVQGVVERYRENLQMKIESFRPVDEMHVNINDFLPACPKPTEPMLKYIKDTIAGMSNAPLRELVQGIFNDAAFAGRFCTAPAGISFHHPYIGGLLEHTSSMLEIGVNLLNCRPDLDADMLVAGIALHDIGKIEELSYSKAFKYTDRGKLLGHLVIGCDIIRQYAANVPDLAPERLELLLHLILSHHGQHEFGSPRLPQTAEALVVHYIDNMDAKLNAIELMKRNSTDPEAVWSEYNKMFQREIYIRSLPDATNNSSD